MRKFWLALIAFSVGCSGSGDETQDNHNSDTDWTAPFIELSDEQYPNDPDIPLRHSAYRDHHYAKMNLHRNEDGSFNLAMIPSKNADTISLEKIELLEWIPTICEKVSEDDYLSEIAIVNQEWNRQQVKFGPGEFQVSGQNKQQIVRVDLARNCLNAYLWELIVYAEEDEQIKPYYHAWFDFPHELYASLFKERNDVDFDKYKEPLENWIDPENKRVPLKKLREVDREYSAEFVNLNNSNYPVKGEREKKFVNIIYPKNTSKMSDFLTDNTLFATFSPPGFYNQADPRKTELSRLANCNEIHVRTLKNQLTEFELQFNKNSKKATNLIVSGIDLDEIPVLAQEDANSGWMSSMGFGNHQFYETYKQALSNSSRTSEYFAFLSDANYNWLDSHDIGIDGPLLHWRDETKTVLDFWILSFERHAFVGHYAISILAPEEEISD